MLNANLRRMAAVVATVAAATAVSGCASAAAPGAEGGAVRTYTFATYMPPMSPPGDAIQWFADEVAERSDGEIKIEPYFSGSLLGPEELLAGTKDGRTDFVHLAPQYNPAELPLSQVVSVPFVNSSTVALGDALSALYEENVDFQNEWTRTGVDPLLFIPAAPTVLATTEEVTTLDGVDGKSIRALGYIAAAVQAAGGNAISLASGELYESLERGLIDGYASVPLDAIQSLSLQEVAPFIADSGLGTFGFTALGVNSQSWASMPQSDRDVIESVLDDFPTTYFGLLDTIEEEACDAILDAGGAVNVWADEQTTAWAQKLGDAPLQSWLASASTGGVDAQAFFDAYVDAVEVSAGENPAPNGMARCAAR